MISWTHGDVALEGLLALPPATGPHPLLVFCTAARSAGMACGEHPDLSAWTGAGWAVFMPDFRSSGIAGRGEMWRVPSAAAGSRTRTRRSATS